MIALTAVTAEPLSLDAHVAAVAGAANGAIATFLGVVRDHDPSVEGEVMRLEYEAHPDAADALATAATAVDRDDVTIAVSHRTGALTVGEAALIAAVASAHRTEAQQVVAALVERIKADVPIWKREILADGSHTWVGVS